MRLLEPHATYEQQANQFRRACSSKEQCACLTRVVWSLAAPFTSASTMHRGWLEFTRRRLLLAFLASPLGRVELPSFD